MPTLISIYPIYQSRISALYILVDFNVYEKETIKIESANKVF